MREKSWTVIYLSAIALLLVAVIPLGVVDAVASTKVRIISEVTELGPDDEVGQRFKVAVVIENVSELYGFDIQLNWTTDYIRYVSHVVTVPAENYPAPNPPSPYEGALHSPFLKVKEIVNESKNIPDADPETMAWFAYAAMAPAEPQNGSATFVVFEFEVVNQPIMLNATIAIHFVTADIANVNATPIACDILDLEIPLYGKPQPAGPTLKVDPELYSYEGPTPHTFDINVSIYNLDEYWDLGGFDIQLNFDPRFAQAINITEGKFLADYNFYLWNFTEIDNTQGILRVLRLQNPENRTNISGNATLFTITFNATTCTPLTFYIDPSTGLAGYGHPERPEPPYNNSESAIVIPYTPVDGLVNIIAVNDHTVTVDNVDYTVTTRSNSSVLGVTTYAPIPMLNFRVAGPEGFGGFCNVTIPKALMWSTIENGWFVSVDGQPITPQVTEDETNTYIYFTYAQSTHYVSIATTNIVPEIGSLYAILLLLTTLAAATLLTSKTLKRKNI